MTTEEQRIAIAEWMEEHTVVELQGKYYYEETAELIPNYPLDLNAMHEAEKKLDKSLAAKYQENLVKICVTLDKLFVIGQKYGLDGYVTHATSQQRSEALCRTLWPERFE